MGVRMITTIVLVAADGVVAIRHSLHVRWRAEEARRLAPTSPRGVGSSRIVRRRYTT